MSENYTDWVSRVISCEHPNKSLSEGEVVTSSSGKPFGALTFIGVSKNKFYAEVAKKNDKYVYHIFPSPNFAPTHDGNVHPIIPGAGTFYELLTKAFLDIFKREDQIEVDWTEEMKAWAIRVSGWTDNVWGDELALRVINLLDELICGRS